MQVVNVASLHVDRDPYFLHPLSEQFSPTVHDNSRNTHGESRPNGPSSQLSVDSSFETVEMQLEAGLYRDL